MTPNDPDCDHFLGPDNSWDGISTRRIGNLHPSPLSLAVLVSVFNLGLKGTQLSIVSLVCEIKTPLLTIICFICYSKKQPNSKIDVLSKVMAFLFSGIDSRLHVSIVLFSLIHAQTYFPGARLTIGSISSAGLSDWFYFNVAPSLTFGSKPTGVKPYFVQTR